MLKALQREIEMRKNYCPEETVETVYLGGGTPSVLETDEINLLLEKVFSIYAIKDHAEITIEINPDDITKHFIQALRSTVINRLSFGCQSFYEKDLDAIPDD